MTASFAILAPWIRSSCIVGTARRQTILIKRSFRSTTRQSFSAANTTTTQSHSIQNRFLTSIHPLHLFRIVQDVDRYQEFLPFCGHSEVFPDTISNGGRSFEADLAVGLGPLFQTRYRSKITVDPDRLIISTVSGKSSSNGMGVSSGTMFEVLTSRWELFSVVIEQGSNADSTLIGTSVDFSVEMTVSDPMVETVLNNVLRQMAETQVQAFEERCLALPQPTDEELSRANNYVKLISKTRN